MKTDLPLTIQNMTGEKLTFLKIDFKDGIEYLETESEVQPNAGPPMHVHYKQDESLTVVSGKIGYQQPGGEKKYAGVGETVLFKAGTPHKFWGYMDYFYVTTGSPAGGLNDPFIKIKYGSSNKRFSAGVDFHYFRLAKNQKDINGKAIDKYLGSEIDVITNYALNKITTVELGFSVMAATKSMEYAKGIAPDSAKLTGTWSYLMISVKPEFLFK